MRFRLFTTGQWVQAHTIEADSYEEAERTLMEGEPHPIEDIGWGSFSVMSWEVIEKGTYNDGERQHE